jgi:hypothetical protein
MKNQTKKKIKSQAKKNKSRKNHFYSNSRMYDAYNSLFGFEVLAQSGCGVCGGTSGPPRME